MKRAIDVLVSALLLLMTAWLQLLIALAVKVDSPGPALFCQRRVGKRGELFSIYKFRSMRWQASAAREAIVVGDFHSYVFSPPGFDPRVTRAGRVLRAASLDELPQLWNVLRGDMSLVGPRPELPEIVAQYPASYEARHDVRPGITGVAQISGRADLTYHQIMLYDLDYVASHSLWRDLAILARTAVVVFSARGAR